MNELLANKIAIFSYQSPFKVPLMFNGYLLKQREGLIIRLDQQGQLFYAEIAPLPGFSKETLAQAKQQILDILTNNIPAVGSFYPSVAFGLSSLSHDILSLKTQTKLDQIPLLQGTNEQVVFEYQQLNNPKKIKLKVARQAISEELELIDQLMTINPKLMIRLDANQQWNFQQASSFFESVNIQGIDYIEEPTPSHQNNLQLAARYHFNLALDETLQDPDFIYVPDSKVKAFVIKPTLIGDHPRIQSFLDLAQQHKLQVSISSSFESIIGLSHLKLIAVKNQMQCDITLGIDTIKQFQSTERFNLDHIDNDINNLECIWKNY